MQAPLKLLVVAVALASGIGPAGAQDKPTPETKPSSAWETKKPMTFYVAKGAPNICGDGCSEWIAAEGSIGPHSATKLRELLNRTGRQQLPIIFNSRGGLQTEGIAVGRLLRQRGMKAMIGETLPVECDRFIKADVNCESLKQSGKKLQADLTIADARCSSACGYALLGGKERWVPAGAKIGIHSGRTLARKGDKTRVVEKPSKDAEAAMQKALRQYIREMGVDTKFVDAAEKIPFEKIHYLTREEIIGFRIDTREFQETPWTYGRTGTGAYAALKFWTEATGTTKKEFPINLLQLACGGGNRLFLTYYRGIASDSSPAVYRVTASDKYPSPQIELAAGDRIVAAKFQGSTQATWIESERRFESYWAFLDSDFAAAAPKDGIKLKGIAPPGEISQNILKLSPAGWSAAIDNLKCGKF